MKQIYTDVIQFRGSHYDYGLMQGELLVDSLTIENREKQWRLRKPRFEINEQEAKEAITRYAPFLWDELIGLQDALKWPLQHILQDFGGYRNEMGKSGCSTITGKDYLIRNYDYHPKTYEGRYTLYQPSDGGNAMIGPSQRITGRMDGMNEHGLAMGYNFMHRKIPGDGFICNAIGRIILESCKTAEEAADLLAEIPHRHSFSYILFDKTGTSYVVEATPRTVDIREANMCTNHFERLEHENRRVLSESKERMDVIRQNNVPDMDARSAFRMLNDSDKGIFSDEYRNWSGTIHTSGYLPMEMKAWFSLGGDKEPEEIDFNAWLQGEDLKAETFQGQVDTTLGFLSQDENVK
ncbi:C45 family autoproteolytic acyltransferase/hydrolase [Aciduricibacillus chroicocephali]|uniref:C45 family autoproteolytic acyltransferase/hydrolase n=1 Tax=Aciduricibacillus chroicocephali TaxID=3054939 RepID=A0ABY9KX21_9BACI|nr:C45 family autoproteolytic acyltransferase/hydrolase [Bacillaceae bacterium 44XB]